MEVLNILEKDDGSALVTLYMSQKEINILVKYAVTNILKEAIQCEEVEQSEITNTKD